MNRLLLTCLFSVMLAPLAMSQVQFEFESVRKLSTAINGDYEETSPLFDHVHNRLYFSRTLHPENKGGETSGQDLWYSNLQGNEWSAPSNDLKQINNYLNNATIGLSADGEHMYMLGTYIRKIALQSGLSMTTLDENGEWTRPEALDIKSLSIRSPFYGGYVMPDEKVMIISMESYNTKGQEDLYVSFKEGDHWTKPIWLGDSINSTGFEISPFIFDDGKTLMFASNGFGGEGDCDIFYAYRKDSTWTNWTKPVNPGAPLNSSGFDAFPYAVGDLIYFSSNRNDSLSNLYTAENSKYYKDAETVRLVFEAFETRVSDLIVKVLNQDGEEIGRHRPGQYDIVSIPGLKERKSYTLVPEHPTLDLSLFKPLLLNENGDYMEVLNYNDQGQLEVIPRTPEQVAQAPVIPRPEYVAGMQGIFEVDRTGVSGIMLALEDENGKIYQYAKTQKGGAFKFAETPDSLNLHIRVLTELEYIKQYGVIYYTDYRGNKLFKSVQKDGVYKYQKLQARELAQLKAIAQTDSHLDPLSSPSKGIFSFENLPKEGVKLQLYDENNQLIEEVVTDEKGEFVFSKLRADQNFSIRPADGALADGSLSFTDELGNPMESLGTNEFGFKYKALRPELVQGLKLLVDEYDDNRLAQNFVFTIGLYKYKSLPKEGISLNLLDENDNIVETVTTDASGHFVFSMLKPNKNYRVQVVGLHDTELIQTQLYFVDKAGTVNTARLDADEYYSFDQLQEAYFFNIGQINSDEAKTLVVESFKDVIGRFNYQDLPKSGVKLELLDQNQKVIETVYTDENGNFIFSKLAKESEYFVRIAESDQALLDQARFEFENEENEKLVQEGVTEEGFKFVTLAREDGSIAGLRLTDNPSLDISRFLPKEMTQTLDEDGNYPPNDAFDLLKNELKMRSIYFNFNSVRLSNNDRYHLNHDVYLPARRSGQPILLVGYSCDLGDPETAAEVSKMRAEIIKKYLVNLGMDPDLIEVEGIGTPGETLTPAERMERRRVDVYHLGP
jgi:outer membrane protein OmpA-like peptidoglycan-associated protein